MCPYHNDVVCVTPPCTCGWYEARNKESVSNLARNRFQAVTFSHIFKFLRYFFHLYLLLSHATRSFVI